MNRLISFGCSYTYGDGLLDKINAWPFVLGKLLSRNVLNQAVPGSGNLEILWNVLNYEFDSSDVCFVMWSHFSRDHIFHPTKHQRIHMYDDNLTKYWLLTHTEYDANIRNWLYIQHCDLYLKSKGIKVFHLFGGDYDQERFSNPKCIELSNVLDIPFENFDLGYDKSHPGRKSHKILAEKIYNSVNGLISHK
jgi:hypothetical protein